MYKEILVHAYDEDTTVAVIEDRKLVEIYFERTIYQRTVGNIYKGRVENVLPGMQAAFVDIGLEKNAFLYVEDASPQDMGYNGEKPEQKISINDVLKEGQEIVVQVAKEPFGKKGARVTTHITLPGRYVVLMPSVDYVGVSRRIETEEERERLRKLADELRPKGMGVIVRTVAQGLNGEELQKDLEQLNRLWRKICRRAETASAPSVIHRDLELLQRILRDLFTEDVDRFLVNSREDYEKVIEALEVTAPHLKNKVSYENRDLFDEYAVSAQIDQAIRRKVWLKSGGYIVIDQMEALTAIDVNTGKYVGATNLADTVFLTNQEAAVEIARQLRLRNIGGIILIDFIDMASPLHKQAVMDLLEQELKKDRTKTTIVGMTQLGLVEMTRKKARKGLESLLQRDCPYCEGKGKVLSEETVSMRAKKRIVNLAGETVMPAIYVEAHPLVAAQLIGCGGSTLRQLEEKTGKTLVIKGIDSLHIQEVNMRAIDEKEADNLAVPVREGQILEVKIEEIHTGKCYNGIGRVQGYVISVQGGASLVGQVVPVEIIQIHRTYALAKPVGLMGSKDLIDKSISL